MSAWKADQRDGLEVRPTGAPHAVGLWDRLPACPVRWASSPSTAQRTSHAFALDTPQRSLRVSTPRKASHQATLTVRRNLSPVERHRNRVGTSPVTWFDHRLCKTLT